MSKSNSVFIEDNKEAPAGGTPEEILVEPSIADRQILEDANQQAEEEDEQLEAEEKEEAEDNKTEE